MIHDNECKDLSCGCDNPNPNLTLSQSRQRELVRVPANLLYTTYTCSTICHCLLIQCYYIIKRK